MSKMSRRFQIADELLEAKDILGRDRFDMCRFKVKVKYEPWYEEFQMTFYRESNGKKIPVRGVVGKYPCIAASNVYFTFNN